MPSSTVAFRNNTSLGFNSARVNRLEFTKPESVFFLFYLINEHINCFTLSPGNHDCNIVYKMLSSLLSMTPFSPKRCRIQCPEGISNFLCAYPDADVYVSTVKY